MLDFDPCHDCKSIVNAYIRMYICNLYRYVATNELVSHYSIILRDLQYISIWQYIDTLIEYHIVILYSINIEISKCLIVLSGAHLRLLIYVGV